MKLVIDISEETYKAIMKPFSTFKEQRTHKSVITEACIAIANGKPQEPKTGHWIKTGYIDKVTCSICKRKMWNFWEVNDFNYCPHCGAKMVELKESEDKE